MTKVTFFNEFNPDERWTQDALDSNIGKELPLTNTITGETGTAKILDVKIDEMGVEVTYETDMNFKMRMDNFTIEPPEAEVQT